MKFILPLVALLGLATAEPIDDLIACVEDRCPDQYAKCKANASCESKLRSAADKCGLVVNQICWGSVVMFNNPAIAVCNCAVQQKCLGGSGLESEISFEKVGKMIDQYLRSD